MDGLAVLACAVGRGVPECRANSRIANASPALIRAAALAPDLHREWRDANRLGLEIRMER